jgi:hypothetical protein
MANINASIKTGSGFLLKNAPLDLKLTAATIAERNTYIALGNNVLYKGAIVYVEEDNTFYVFNGTDPTGEDYSACWDHLIPSDIEGGNFATLNGTNAFTGANSFTQAPTVNGQAVATTNDVSEAITGAVGDTVQAHNDKLDDVAGLSAGLLAGTADAIVGRTLESTTLTVTNGDGVAGNPTVELKAVGTAGTYTKVTTDAQGRVTAGENPTTLQGYGITDALPLSGGTMTGALKVLAPVADDDAVNKKYADSVALGYTFHVSCATGSNSNVEGTYQDGSGDSKGVGATFTLTADTGNTTQIGGLTLRQDMRVMLVGQTDAKQNGCYKVTTFPGEATGHVVLTRADDFDGDPEISYNGATFLITHGDLRGTSWRLMNNGKITFGTDEINFVQISAPNEYSAGDGISIEANEVSVKQGATVKVIGGNLEVASGTSNQGKVLVAQGDGTAASWQALDLSSAVQGTLPVNKGGTGATTLPANQLIIGNGTDAVGSVTNADGVLVGSTAGAPAFGKVNLASHVEGVLPVANGGFGTATHTEGAIVVGGAGNALAEVAPAAGVLKSTGTGAPAYGQVDLTTEVSGALPIANGGTGATEKAQAFANLAPAATTKGDIMYYDGSQWVAFAKGAQNSLLGYGADGLQVVTKISAGTF